MLRPVLANVSIVPVETFALCKELESHHGKMYIAFVYVTSSLGWVTNRESAPIFVVSSVALTSAPLCQASLVLPNCLRGQISQEIR